MWRGSFGGQCSRRPSVVIALVLRTRGQLRRSHCASRLATMPSTIPATQWRDEEDAAGRVEPGGQRAPSRLRPSARRGARRRRAGDVVLAVHASGTAIPGELLPVIFDPFRRAAGSKPSGLGLGLFITQQIVLAHDRDDRRRVDGGGRHDLHRRAAEARPGAGLRVIVSAPRAAASRARAARRSAPTRSRAPPRRRRAACRTRRTTTRPR